jgi:hydrogenase nickel incorporation protein HypA/HybF
MHELGLVFEVIRRVEAVAAENRISRVQKVVLSIGEISYVVPMFIREVYAPACQGTVLEGSELEIETVPARGKCRACRRVFDIVKFEGACPHCGGKDYEVLSGDEFLIKEICVPENEVPPEDEQ